MSLQREWGKEMKEVAILITEALRLRSPVIYRLFLVVLVKSSMGVSYWKKLLKALCSFSTIINKVGQIIGITNSHMVLCKKGEQM